MVFLTNITKTQLNITWWIFQIQIEMERTGNVDWDINQKPAVSVGCGLLFYLVLLV